MNDADTNIVHEVIEQMGGYGAIAKLMGGVNATTLRDIADGKRIPGETTRRRLVKATRGRLSETDIIAIVGAEKHDSRALYNVHPMWDADEDDLRYAIWEKARDGARAQRIANQRRRLR